MWKYITFHFVYCLFSALILVMSPLIFFFFNYTATTEIYTLSLHDALPIYGGGGAGCGRGAGHGTALDGAPGGPPSLGLPTDRKSTRLNSSHSQISYAGFFLKKKKNNITNLYVFNTRY